MTKIKSERSFKRVLLALLAVVFYFCALVTFALNISERNISSDGVVEYIALKPLLYLWSPVLTVSLIASGLYFLVLILQKKPLAFLSWVFAVVLGISTFVLLLFHMTISLNFFAKALGSFGAILYFVLPFAVATIVIFGSYLLTKKKPKNSYSS